MQMQGRCITISLAVQNISGNILNYRVFQGTFQGQHLIQGFSGFSKISGFAGQTGSGGSTLLAKNNGLPLGNTR